MRGSEVSGQCVLLPVFWRHRLPAGAQSTTAATARSFPSAVLARTEDGGKSKDDSVNREFDGLGTTREFL